VKLETVDGILEHLIQLVILGQVVVLDEVGDRRARVLNLLKPVTEGIERDGIYGSVDDVLTVVPVQQPSNALVNCGVAHESITRQFVVSVRSKADSDTSVHWIIKRGILGGAEGWASSDGAATRRPEAWKAAGIGNVLGESGHREKESDDE